MKPRVRRETADTDIAFGRNNELRTPDALGIDVCREKLATGIEFDTAHGAHEGFRRVG